jgi:hypothetical protein
VSTPVIIIITPPKQQNRVVADADGARIVDAEGVDQATFNGPEAYDNAIKYLKVMKG